MKGIAAARPGWITGTALALVPLATAGSIRGTRPSTRWAIVILSGLLTSMLLYLFMLPSVHPFGRGATA